MDSSAERSKETTPPCQFVDEYSEEQWGERLTGPDRNNENLSAIFTTKMIMAKIKHRLKGFSPKLLLFLGLDC